MIFLQPITPETALVFKAVRLRALADSPLAFSATHEAESRLSDEEWIRRSERWNGQDAIGFFAFDTLDNKRACGLVGCFPEIHPEDNAVPHGHVVSMWVDPAYRRTGAGSLLIDGLKNWAKAHGLRQLKLMVTSVNPGAAEFYRRVGFRMSGKTEPYPNDPAIVEHEMVLDL
jgi:ribosomal protein S18 acetylase RimI-like enzyme